MIQCVWRLIPCKLPPGLLFLTSPPPSFPPLSSFPFSPLIPPFCPSLLFLPVCLEVDTLQTSSWDRTLGTHQGIYKEVGEKLSTVRFIFQLHYCVQSIVVQNFHLGWGSYALRKSVRFSCIHTVCMSPTDFFENSQQIIIVWLRFYKWLAIILSTILQHIDTLYPNFLDESSIHCLKFSRYCTSIAGNFCLH